MEAFVCEFVSSFNSAHFRSRNFSRNIRSPVPPPELVIKSWKQFALISNGGRRMKNKLRNGCHHLVWHKKYPSCLLRTTITVVLFAREYLVRSIWPLIISPFGQSILLDILSAYHWAKLIKTAHSWLS